MTMICNLRWPLGSSSPCGQSMIPRWGHGTSPLFACPVHDGDAADPAKVNPRFNQPRPKDRP